MPESIEKTTRLATGTTADVYAWGDGRILKLFHEHTPMHANEVAASRAAHAAGLPVPAVLSDIIEVGEQEGIVFERINGPTLTEYLQNQSEAMSRSAVLDYARQAAKLHAEIHSTKASDLPSLVEILHWSIQEAHPLDKETRQAVLDLLHGLPERNVLCHNDFYPRNLVVSHGNSKAGRLLVIDWALGLRGNPLADCARTWLISRLWLAGLREQGPNHVYRTWQRFWEAYFRRYAELRPYTPQEFIPWQAVTAAASLCWDGSRVPTEPRESLIHAALNREAHPWLYHRDHKSPILSA